MTTRRISILASLLGLLSMGAMGQQTGNLEGRIVDAEGAPVSFVSVSVRGAALTGVRGTISRLDGRFAIVGLPVGEYQLSLQHVSYHDLLLDGVRVRLGATATIGEVTLTLQSYQMEEQTIMAERLIDPESTEVDANLSADTMQHLPMDRDYRSVIAYTPQANTSYLGDSVNIAGGTGQDNSFIVDGIEVTDPYQKRFGMRLPQNFIREIEVKSGGYQAEYGRSAAGIVNVITKTGSNEFHGDVFAYFTGNDLASDRQRGLRDLEQFDFQRYDIGIGVGGPVVRDKLWYYAAYDPTVQSEDLRIPGFDVYEDRKVVHQFAGKLTWKAGENTRFNLTTLGDPSGHDNVGPNTLLQSYPASVSNPDVLLGRKESGGIAVALDGQHLFGERVVLEGSLSRHQDRDKAEPLTEVGRTEPTLLNFETGNWEGGYQNIYDHRSVRYSANLSGTIFAGDHKLKGGAEYRSTHLDEYWQLMLPNGDNGWIWQWADDNYQSIGPFIRDGDVNHQTPALFVQDSWAVHPRLRVNAGLRWDGMFIEDADGNLQQKITDQYQPRFGFVWQLDEAGTQRIHGSAGRYYDQMATFSSAWNAGRYSQYIVFTSNDPRGPAPVDTTDVYLIGQAENDPAIDGLKGEHHDEITLGYDREFGSAWSLSLVGIFREQREIIENSRVNGAQIFGNPGRGGLSHLPDPMRRYTALEVTGSYRLPRSSFTASYVLSRNYGNYTGTYNSDQSSINANSNTAWDYLESISKGPLPNDRTHVFKLHGSHAFHRGFTVGGFFTVQSGTPLSEYYRPNLFAAYGFLGERGDQGRTPAIWDLNLRLSYDLPPGLVGNRARSRLLLDAFHLFSAEEVVAVEQLHYATADTDPANASATYGRALRYQPPMTFRMGIETSF